MKKGFTIIEIILAMGLFAIVVGGAVGVALQSFSINRLGEEKSKANFLSSQGIEAARAISNRDFYSLVNGSHGLSSAEGRWEFSGASDSLDKFTREIVVSNVYRDENGNIVESGGTLDLFTKKVEALVTWDFLPGRQNSTSTTTYFTHWTESICTWDSASVVSTVDLPGEGDAQDIDAKEDKAYVTTFRNPPTSGEFFILDIADPQNPSILGQFSLREHVFAVDVQGERAYLATAASSNEVVVLNIADPQNISQVGIYDLPGNSQANDIFALDDVLYVTSEANSQGAEVYILDISNPNTPSPLGTFELGSRANGVYVFEDFAYIANSVQDKELVVLDVSNPQNPVEVGSYDVPLAGANGQAVSWGGGVVHLTTRNNTGDVSEYYLLEASDPTNISLIGEYNVSSRTNGAEPGAGFSLLATEKDGEELMIIDLSDPSNPTLAFSSDMGANAFGLALKECFAFFSTANDGGEVRVVAP